MKKFLVQIKKHLITGIITLGCIILYVGLGGSGRIGNGRPFNIYLVITGLLILFPFGIFSIYFFIKGKRQQKNKKIALEIFKSKAHQIKVNLENLEIKSNSWFEEIDNDDEEPLIIKKNPNHIKLQIPFNGKIIEYSFDREMDTTILKMKFALEKETTFYIDKLDENNTYLDLEFLNP